MRLFYTVKLDSGLLKENKYNLNLSFYECLKSNLIISLADSQMLRSIRDITGKKIDREQLEEWWQERDSLKKKKNSKANRQKIKELQDKIYDMMYIPEYITVVMESIKDYERIFKKGFYFNGKLYKRMSCSASQARVSTVVFVEDSIREELRRRLDNGRDLNKPLAPSKYNAYFGLYSSATKKVSKPRFCIIPDYNSNLKVDVDYVIETGADEDDIIEPRTIDVEFNRFDGSGLISPQMAEQWGKDLGEDYTPCQFCIRCAFTKGMVNEFDFVEWCKDENDGNYIITDIYGEKRDLREIDVILTEGQVKLWDSWKSQESFEQCCEENGIIWGCTKYAPKKDKNVLTMNYQFLQTLNLTDEMIDSLCQDTVDYIQGVSYENVYYTLLFLLGENLNSEGIQKFMDSSDNYWLKCLILNHSLLNDKYSKEKIRDFIVRKIELACLGKINTQGNFAVIVPDSYAFMQHCTGQRVTGLLRDGEFYLPYWARYDKEIVACGRSPMTHFSEWCIVKNKYKLDSEYENGTEKLNCYRTPDNWYFTDEEVVAKIKKYFKYSYSGVITNVHGYYTMNMSGSDFDMDIACEVCNDEIINGKIHQRVVTYTAKKPQKKLFTEEDLFVTDTFSFKSLIGPLTNVASTICGLLPLWPKDSEEYKLLKDRVAMCCAGQSRQIDKTKIGQAVKGIPSIWKNYQRYSPDDTEEEKKKKDFYNSILADRKPYFFRYKYNTLNKEFNEYMKKIKEDCEIRFCVTFDELRKLSENELTEEQKSFLEYYEKYLPVVDSNCVMNKICKHIESVDFHIKQKVKATQGFDYRILVSENFAPNKLLYRQICEEIFDTLTAWDKEKKELKKPVARIGTESDKRRYFDKDNEYILLKQRLEQICSNEEMLANHLVYLFYVDKPSYNKSILWNIVGKQIYETVKSKTSSFYFPEKNPNGTLEFLYEKYSIERVIIPKEENLDDRDLQ